MTLHLPPDRLFADVTHVASTLRQTGQAGSGLYRDFGKRVVDIAIVALIIPLVLPVMLLMALILCATGVNPLYSQLRIGRGGQSFRIWKFQTMQQNADKLLADLLQHDEQAQQEWNSRQKLKNDPRVTRVGQFLRKTSLDELPQLWNVLRGDMSLLGPRPMMLDQAKLYGPTLSAYTSLRPGISGKWQVSERNDADFARRAEIDLQYARELSFANDLRLVWQTLRTVVRSTGY